MWIKSLSTQQRGEMIRGKFLNRSNICLSYFPLHKNAVLITTWYWLFGTRISLHSCRWGTSGKQWSIWGASFLTWGEVWTLQVRLVNSPAWAQTGHQAGQSPRSPICKIQRPCPFMCLLRFKGSTYCCVCWNKEELQGSLEVQPQTAPSGHAHLWSRVLYFPCTEITAAWKGWNIEELFFFCEETLWVAQAL